MAVLEVLHYPDPRLRHPALAVAGIDASVRQLCRDMLETMYAERGIGLAATQVNVALRVVVMDLSTDADSPLFLVNPEILQREGSEEMEEGCLSVPGYFEKVVRAERIRFRYLSLESEVVEADADGLFAVCIQHEIDHLDGKLFIDYLSPLKRQRLKKKIEKQERQLQVL